MQSINETRTFLWKLSYQDYIGTGISCDLNINRWSLYCLRPKHQSINAQTFVMYMIGIVNN